MRVEEEWKKRSLPDIPSSSFENRFEEVLYKTLNLIRTDPQWAVPYIKNVIHHKHYTGGNIEQIIGILKSTKALSILEVSCNGIAACRKANDEIKDSAYSNHYGIIKAYNQLYSRN